jgi:hypothetical protein
MKNLFVASVCALSLWLVTPAAAHHSMAGFDRKNPVTLVGTVKNFNWQNPHCWIELEVPGKDGKTVTWNVEMTAPGYLARAGWKKDSVKPGEKVSIRASPMLNGEPGALFISVTREDGQTLTQRGLVTPNAKAK